MSMSVGGDEEDMKSDINVTPLVDVMLVLLIIFIITIPVFIQQVKLQLPIANNLVTVTKPENITISVDKDGAMYWNGRVLSGVDDLKTQLRSVVRNDPQPEIHIRGDGDSRYQYVGQVLVATQQIGMRKVAFITQPDRSEGG